MLPVHARKHPVQTATYLTMKNIRIFAVIVDMVEEKKYHQAIS